MDPQLKAIETIERNIAVNAGAGTGKTKVLTERFVYILEHGNLELNKEVESIVAITFTKKATQEMVERIRKEIRNNFSKGAKWSRFYRDMEKSNISTIHSFCGKLLRENPIESKVDPLFEVLEDGRAKLILSDSITEALTQGLEDKNLFKLLLTFKEFHPKNLVEDITAVYNLIRTVGLSLVEVKRISIDYLDSLVVDKKDIETIKEAIIYLQSKLTKASGLVKLESNELWIKFKNNNYKDEDLFSILEYIKSKIGTSKKEPEYFDILKSTIDKVLTVKEKDSKWLYESLLDLLVLIDDLYTKKKEKISALDYDDLQIKVLELLDNTEIKKKYQAKYRYIMIDEFQDTNELQKKIFYKLSTNNEPLDQNNLFVVGDPKQSIYAFRGADIEVFYNVLKDIKNITNEEHITLSTNYRTVDTVLGFINDIFSKLMKEKYSPLTPHHMSTNQIDIEILENKEFEGNREKSIILEANLIAKRIKELVSQGKYKYKDFALLFRATTRNLYYEEAFKNYSIPYYNSSSKQFYRRQEILDLINALKVISNPFDTISFIGFLRGHMVGLSDNSIFWLLKNKDLNLYKTIVNAIDLFIMEISDEDIERLKDTKVLLDYLYSIKGICSISFLIEKLIEKTYFIEGQLLMNKGKQSTANIYKFIDIVGSFENTSKLNLEAFIDYIEILKEDVASEGIIESKDSDVVNLLTIHKSKGLQFPVVIIPEMSNDIRSQYPKVLFNKDIGIGIKTEDNKTIYEKIKKDLEERDKEERKRILYVAMTRAEKLLILGNQGKSRGFKALIEELLDLENINTINEVEIETDNNTPIKCISHEKLNTYSTGNISLPLLNLENSSNKLFERYSISQFLTFKECRRQFFLDYYKRLNIRNEYEEKEHEANTLFSAIDKGNIIHKFCEHYNPTVNKKELVEKITISYGIKFDENIYNELIPYINNYINYYNNNDFHNVFIEKVFYLKLGNNYISGIIDRVNIKNDSIEILDIKTNRVRDKEYLIGHYMPQLSFYVYAIEKIMKKKVEKASILFLENGEMINLDISENSINDVVKDILEFIDFVENNSIIESYKKSKICNNFCQHRKICEGIGD